MLTPTKRKINDHGLDDLMSNIHTLYMNRQNADMVLVCGDVTIPVHSFILCPRSKFFDAAINGPFKEGSSKRVELPEDNPFLVDRLIRCCYTTTYDDGTYTLKPTSNPNHAFVSRIQFHAEMYAMCEKFAMHGIKKLAEQQFKALLVRPVPPVMYSMSNQILDVIPNVYQSTVESDRGLRDHLISYVAIFWESFTRLARFKSDMADNAEFAYDLLMAKCKEACEARKEVCQVRKEMNQAAAHAKNVTASWVAHARREQLD